MLTKELAIAKYERGRVYPDRLQQKTHGHYLHYAAQMLEVYREGTGKTRRELHRAVRKIFKDEPGCPSRRIDAFCKLLDDASKYETDKKGKAAALRKRVFRLAHDRHPLVTTVDRFFENSERAVKQSIAEKLKMDWEDIQRDFFADIPDYHRLKQFEGYPDARGLLSRYNVAQAQVALFRADNMTIWAHKDLKTILRYAKLARLMHTIKRERGGSYRIIFDGPASVLRETRRYGINMAKFLPALLTCESWRLHARLVTSRPGYMLSLQLTSKDGLKSHLPPPEEFDSKVEANFAAKWGEGKREGWTLNRESDLLHHGQKVFFPDFVLSHESGRIVFMEIVGFWTPEYLKAKMETLELFKKYDILVAVAEEVAHELPGLPDNAIRYKSALKLKDVLARLGEENLNEKPIKT